MRKFSDLKFEDIKQEILTALFVGTPENAPDNFVLLDGFVKHGLHSAGAFGAPGSQVFHPFVLLVHIRTGNTTSYSLCHLLPDIEI